MLDACKELGFYHPTLIQQKCIPAIMQGKNLIGQAKTGSGKTAAFAIPMLEKLSQDVFGVFGMVLTPTRELAYQISEQFQALGVSMGLKQTVIVGGMDWRQQTLALEARPHIVIATPGRLAHLIRNGNKLHTDHLEFLVLDEADRLFEDCFNDDIEMIVSQLPPSQDRQTLLFSATITEKIKEFQNVTEEDMVFVTSEAPDKDGLSGTGLLVATLDARYIFIPQAVKECYLVYVLREALEKNEDQSVMVFASTCRGCEVITQLLRELEFDCVGLHSQLTQNRRMASLGKFKSGRSKIMVATDVASRGLDIPAVGLVINYDVPRVPDDYIHRVGRTARAGRGGLAITVVSQYDISLLKTIEEETKTEMKEHKLNEDTVLEIMKEVSYASRMAKVHLEEFDLVARKVKRKSHFRKNDTDGDVQRETTQDRETAGSSKKKRKVQAAPAKAAAAIVASKPRSKAASNKKRKQKAAGRRPAATPTPG